MRIKMIAAIALATLLAACVGGPVAPRPPETVVAKVNGDPIRQSDVDSRVEALIRQARELRPELTEKQLTRMQPKLARQAVDELIDAKLIAAAEARDPVKVSEAKIDERLRVMDDALHQEGMSLDRLRQTLRTTTETLRENVRERLREETFWDRRVGVTPPSEEELRAAYEKNPDWFTLPPALHLYDVYLPLPAERPSLSQRRDLRTHAEALRARLQAGEAFATVARDAAGTRALGKDGDLGWVTQQSPLPTGLLKAAFRQDVGRVGDVIESADGFHILVVGEKRGEQMIPLEQVRERLSAELMRKARQARIPGEIKKMRSEAKIERE